MNYNEIACKLLEGIAPAQDKPFYVLAAGGPASHKCFLPFILKNEGYKHFIAINDELIEPFFPRQAGGYPHHEKSEEHIKAYYNLIDEIVKEAGTRNISVVLEEHGDYPAVYKKHIEELGTHGYENFLIGTTISPSNFDAKIEYLMKHDGLPDFRNWGKAYHKRVADNFDALLEMFDRGMLIETQPSFLSADNNTHAYAVMRFARKNDKPAVEIIDEERYKTFQRWKEQHQPEFQSYFHASDAAMESRDAAGGYAQSVAGSRNSGEGAPKKESFIDNILNGSVETKPIGHQLS